VKCIIPLFHVQNPTPLPMHASGVNLPTRETMLLGRDLWMMFFRGRAMWIEREMVQTEAFMTLVHASLHLSPLRAHDKMKMPLIMDPWKGRSSWISYVEWEARYGAHNLKALRIPLPSSNTPLTTIPSLIPSPSDYPIPSLPSYLKYHHTQCLN
jgi:hypothetical protein